MKHSHALSMLSLAVLVAACGGGGGGGAGGVSTSAAEGVYQGTTSTGKTVSAIVLENGTFWDMYGVMSGNTLMVQGISVGTSTASGGTFAATIADIPAPGNSAISGTMSGTYVAGASLSGTLTEGSTTTTFSMTVPVSSTYNYNTPANLSAVTGSWSGGLLDGETATITIASNGSTSGTTSLGCSFTGTTTARASGKNVFDVSLTFGAAPCVLPNQTITGNALVYPLGNGTTQMIAGFVNASHTMGSAFFAVR